MNGVVSKPVPVYRSREISLACVQRPGSKTTLHCPVGGMHLLRAFRVHVPTYEIRIRANLA